MRSVLLLEHTDAPTPSQTDYIAEETGVGMIVPIGPGVAESRDRASVERAGEPPSSLPSQSFRDAPDHASFLPTVTHASVCFHPEL